MESQAVTGQSKSASWEEAGQAIEALEARGFAVDIGSYSRNGELHCRVEFRDFRTGYYATASSIPDAVIEAARKIPA